VNRNGDVVVLKGSARTVSASLVERTIELSGSGASSSTVANCDMFLTVCAGHHGLMTSNQGVNKQSQSMIGLIDSLSINQSASPSNHNQSSS